MLNLIPCRLRDPNWKGSVCVKTLTKCRRKLPWILRLWRVHRPIGISKDFTIFPPQFDASLQDALALASGSDETLRRRFFCSQARPQYGPLLEVVMTVAGVSSFLTVSIPPLSEDARST